MNLPKHVKECKDYNEWEPTEEGYNWKDIRYNVDGDRIYADIAEGGKDCDGVLEHRYSCEGTILPGGSIEWDYDKEKVSVYDQYAQMAGY